MNRIKYRRITDWNGSLHGLDRHLSFEAAFYTCDDDSLIFCSRAIDSQQREIICSQDLRNLDPSCLDRYQKWNPTEELAEFIEDVASLKDGDKPVAFSTPMHEMTLEVQASIFTHEDHQIYPLNIHMPECLLLNQYHLKDSGLITVSLLCKKESLFQFLQDLQQDLLNEMSTKSLHLRKQN